MTTAQIIVFTVLAILGIIGFAGCFLSKKENQRMAFGVLLMTVATIVFMIALIGAEEINKLREQNKGKCPEYEKIENVYKLKK